MMRTRSDVLQACLSFADAFEDYPFDDPGMTAVRHKSNQRIFALIFERDGNIWINLKAEPLKATFWRDAYEKVLPGWHMNKRHWISLILDGSIASEDVLGMIADSFALTSPKTRSKGK